MSVEFKTEGLGELQQELLDLAGQQFPQETQKFMGSVGTALVRKVRAGYDKDIKEHCDNLLRPNTGRGKPYIYAGDEYSVRVKSKAPHAHLIEHGHVLYIKGKPTNRYVKGTNTVGKAVKAFEKNYEKQTQKFIDKMLDKGLR